MWEWAAVTKAFFSSSIYAKKNIFGADFPQMKITITKHL
jgi:hypothetical protein